MTKSLTKQWEDGKLHFGFYYVKFPNEEPQIYSSEYLKSFTVVKDAEKIKVLAPVPTYEDFLIHRDYCRDHQKLLVENINLKEQLTEANKVVRNYISLEFGIRDKEKKPTVLQLAYSYLEKWGVK